MTGATPTESLRDSTLDDGVVRWKIHRFIDAYFTADAQAVGDLLPSQLRPFRWSPHRTVVSLISGDWEWWNGSDFLCRSGTMIVSASVGQGSGIGPVAMLRGMRVGGPSDRFIGGSYFLQVATTNRTALDLFAHMYGVAGFIADIHHEQRPTFDRFICSRHGELITDLTVGAMGRASRMTSARDRGFLIRDGRLAGYFGEADGTARSRVGRKSAELKLGDGGGAAILRELELSPRPFAGSIWLEGEQRVIPANRDFGPVAEPLPIQGEPEPAGGTLTISREPGEHVEIDQDRPSG